LNRFSRSREHRAKSKKKKKKKKKPSRFFFFFFFSFSFSFVSQLGQSDISDSDMKLVLARAAAQRKFVQEMSALRQRRRLGALQQQHAPFCTNDELVVALAQCDDDDDDCALRLARPSFVARVRELCSQRSIEPSSAVLPRRNLRTNARALFVRGFASLPPKVRAAPVAPRLHSASDADGKPRLKGFFIASEIQNSSTIAAVCSAVTSSATAADGAAAERKRKRGGGGESSVDENESEDVEDIAIVDSSNTSTTAVVMNRESGRLCLDDAVRRAHAGSFDGWSDARKRAFKSMNENPNAYYYRFNAPGEEQKNGHWSPDEEKLFFEVAKQYPVNTKWGLFSIHIPGRVGYQCSNFYRQLLRSGRIKDPNYVLDATGRPRFLFKNKHGDKGVRDYKKAKDGAADGEASADGDNAGEEGGDDGGGGGGGGGQVISRKRLNGAKPPKTPAPRLYDADGNPILRKRGRPRKYPLPGQPLPAAAASTASTADAANVANTAPLAIASSSSPSPPPPPPSLAEAPPIVPPVSTQTSSETSVVVAPPPTVVHSAPKPLTTMMLFEAPLEPVLLVNKSETTASDDAAVPAAGDAVQAVQGDAAEPAEAAEGKSARVRKARAPAKPKKRRRGKGSGDVIFADDVDDTHEVIDFKPSMRMRSALGVENPLPEYIDPITMLPVVAPMMSPAGIVLGKETWLFSLAGKSQCPLTKQPCTFAELTLLTKLNIERLRSRLRV
jgi:hypothetical protein